MSLDFSFYLIAVPAVILVGMSKGGLGDALGLLGVPILSFVMPPAQAAAILLPILIVMDVASLWMWRKHSSPGLVKIFLPGALVGVLIGWLSWAIVPAYAMRLVIGTIALLFSARFFFIRYVRKNASVEPAGHNGVRAGFWSALSGYGSFVAHAGGAPFQIYALPLKLTPQEYTGSAVRVFAVLNAVKLVPYFFLGQLDFTNLWLSATLFPLAPIATIAGAMVVRRMRMEQFYPFMYLMLLIAGGKLIVDGMGPVFVLLR